MSKQIKATANGLASLGRGPDRVLVHMSPKELSGLQSLAVAHGTSLTLHPKTGLPEAGVLDSILPMIAGVAVTAMSGGMAAPLVAALSAGAGAVTKGAMTKDFSLGNLASGALAGYGGGALGGALGGIGGAASTAQQGAMQAATQGAGQAAAQGAQAAAAQGAQQGAAQGAAQGASQVAAETAARQAAQKAAQTTFTQSGGKAALQTMGEGAKNLTNPGITQGLGDLYAGMGSKGAMAAGITGLTAMDSAASSGFGGKGKKPTWYMYGDGSTPGFDQNTQRYGPATTTQDPKVLQSHLLSQSSMQPPPPASVYDKFSAAQGGKVASREVTLADYLYAGGGPVAFSGGGGNRFLRGPGDGVSDSIEAEIATPGQPPQKAALADGEFVVDARTVSELGNGSSEAGARKLYAMMDRIHASRKKALLGRDSGAARALPA